MQQKKSAPWLRNCLPKFTVSNHSASIRRNKLNSFPGLCKAGREVVLQQCLVYRTERFQKQPGFQSSQRGSSIYQALQLAIDTWLGFVFSRDPVGQLGRYSLDWSSTSLRTLTKKEQEGIPRGGMQLIHCQRNRDHISSLHTHLNYLHFHILC